MVLSSALSVRFLRRLVLPSSVLVFLGLLFVVFASGLAKIRFVEFMSRLPNGCFRGGASMVNTQSRIVHIRTILPVRYVVDFIRDFTDDDVQIVWATHDEEGKALHCHIILRFPSVKRWQKLYDWLEKPHDDGSPFDPHAYCKAAKSWTRSVRYLLHLDNPEKAAIPRSSLDSFNLDEDELAQVLAGRSSGLLDAIRAASAMSPYDAFSFLVERRGFRPGECSAGVRLLRELEALKRVRWDLGRSVVVPERVGVGRVGLDGDDADYDLDDGDDWDFAAWQDESFEEGALDDSPSGSSLSVEPPLVPASSEKPKAI